MTHTTRSDRGNEPGPEAFLPLKPNWLHVLLSLAEGERHGYAIRKEVEERTGGAVRLWPATLYGTLAQLADAGLVEETEGVAAPADRLERIYYRLTGLGKRVLAAEAERLAALVRLVRARTAGLEP